MTKVAIIGTGFGARVHLPALKHHPDFEVTAIAGRNPEKTRKIAEEHDISYTTNWRDLLTSDAEVITVSTPPYHHYEMAKKVLKSGKHLLLEKPTTSTALQARELLLMAEERGLVGMLCHEFRWVPERRLLSKLVQESIGDIQEVYVNSYMNFAHSTERPPFGWLWNSKYDGGILGALGSHLIDQVRASTMMDMVEVQGKVFTRTSHRKDTSGVLHRVTADDGFFADFTMENGATGHMVVTATLVHAPENTIIVGGSDRTVMLRGSEVLLSDDEGTFQPVPVPDEFTLEANEADRRIPPFLKLLDQLSLSLSKSTSLSPSLLDGWRNQQVLDAVRESHRLGTTVKIL